RKRNLVCYLNGNSIRHGTVIMEENKIYSNMTESNFKLNGGGFGFIFFTTLAVIFWLILLIGLIFEPLPSNLKDIIFF
ncbi:MAG: hypothetical protein MUP22_16330, partial [Desulfobacterales bacterium]|nr:hypothetical protein [Desulfobacterales bacterium]